MDCDIRRVPASMCKLQTKISMPDQRERSDISMQKQSSGLTIASNESKTPLRSIPRRIHVPGCRPAHQRPEELDNDAAASSTVLLLRALPSPVATVVIHPLDVVTAAWTDPFRVAMSSSVAALANSDSDQLQPTLRDLRLDD